ncbi:MAG TPA: tetraacyldisaccharide 4'-kinase [Gemmatimonadaceae bacterium]|nr:tetraacyldisaccharide 4'-kinase [Gemmatimonadaceae bacterium]
MPASIGREKLRRLSRGIPTVENVWYGRSAGNIVVRAALWPLSKAYDVAMSARTRLYDAGVLHTAVPALPTISVGNLTVGGTGKTPFAAFLATELSRRGKPAIALRGYGGDEVHVHRLLNPGMAVVVNSDRSAAIRDAKGQGAEVVVLDDAFQHRRIARNADVVLLSAEQLLRPRRMLPAGPWREPLAAARRADLLVITRKTATIIDAERAAAAVRAEVPDVRIAMVHLTPSALVNAKDGTSMPLDSLRGSDVVAVAAIGEPELFKLQLEALGASVRLEAYRDHHAYSADDVAEIRQLAMPDGMVVCTLKDAVKLAPLWPGPTGLWYLSQQLVVDQGVEDVHRLLTRVLDARAATPTSAG